MGPGGGGVDGQIILSRFETCSCPILTEVYPPERMFPAKIVLNPHQSFCCSRFISIHDFMTLSRRTAYPVDCSSGAEDANRESISSLAARGPDLPP